MRRTRALVLVLVLLILFIVFLRSPLGPPLGIIGFDTASFTIGKGEEGKVPKAEYDATVVVASQKHDDVRWLTEDFPRWEKVVYVTDDEEANFTVPVNKGREGMVYLSYIIDNYDHLPEVILFLHSKQYQWHNDDPLYDGKRMISRVQLPHIKKNGYANLRCVWTLGCPSEIKPYEESITNSTDPNIDAKKSVAGSYYKNAFEILFPHRSVPEKVGVSCCAQFAVTGVKVREREKKDYEAYRKWLTDTDLKDDLSGRIMEYSWHMIFGQDAVHCPNAAKCYCDLFGLCNLKCETEGVCEEQYQVPKYSTMPNGWPELDWDGKPQNVTELREKQESAYQPQHRQDV